MIAVLQSEWLKHRRTFTRKLIWLAPAFFIVFALLQKLYAPHLVCSWHQILTMVDNWWPVLFVPLGSALLAALTQAHEAKCGGWRLGRTRPVSPQLVWSSKVIVLAAHTLISTMALLIMTLASGALLASGPLPWGELFAGALIPWITSIPLLVIELWVATVAGTGLALAVGAAGLLSGVIMAPSARWVINPWSWPTRLLAPIVGVHPNGVPLPPGDPLLDPSVVPVGLSAALLSAIILTWITALWFARREVR